MKGICPEKEQQGSVFRRRRKVQGDIVFRRSRKVQYDIVFHAAEGSSATMRHASDHRVLSNSSKSRFFNNEMYVLERR
jgi:hypothetical protein